MEFSLLKKRPVFLRLDVLSVPIISFAYNYVFGE